MSRTWAVGVALAVASGAARAGQGAPPPIVNGTGTSDWPAVGALVTANLDGIGTQFCSGTLIDPSYVVTAAHCVEAADAYTAAGNTNYFFVGQNIWDSVDAYRGVSATWTHPQFSYSGTTPLHDIGILELERPISSVDPIPVNTETVPRAWVGEDLTYVGYGITGDGRGDSGQKRTADIPLWDYDFQYVYGLDVTDGQNLCSGDSGGAALKEIDGVWTLVGVNSFVFGYSSSDTSCIGGGSGATRVDRAMDFVLDHVPLGEDTAPPEDTAGAQDSGTDTGLDTAAPDSPAPDSGQDGPKHAADAPACACGPASAPAGSVIGGLALALALVRRRSRPASAHLS